MTYTFRSNMMAYTGLPWMLSLINDDNIDQHKALIQEHRDYSHYLTQEYYPLIRVFRRGNRLDGMAV